MERQTARICNDKLISSKSWSNSYKGKVTKAYYDFLESKVELTWHGAQRFIDRQIDRGGTVLFTKEIILNMVKQPPNFVQSDGQLVNFQSGIAIISNEKRMRSEV